MPIDQNKLVNLGNYANDGTGDDLRTAFQKVNDLFEELSGDVNIIGAVNLGSGVGVFSQKNLTNLQFKSLTSTDQSVTITSDSSTVNLASTARVSSDPSPSLNADLDINGKRIIDSDGTGDLQTSVYGINIPIVNALVELIIASGNVNINFGTFQQPTGTSVGGLDLGGFNLPYGGTNLDFGTFA